MSVQLRKLRLVSPAEAAPYEQPESLTVNDGVQVRRRPNSVDPRPTGEAGPRPENNEDTCGAPWSFIDEIESHVGLYTVAELATVLQRSTCSIYRMAHRRQLPSLRVGGLLYFDPAALGMLFRKKSPESAAAARFSRTLLPAQSSRMIQKGGKPR